MTKHDWTEETLRSVLALSNSYREALMRLGVPHQGGNYKTLKHKISIYGIDISHMKHNGINRGVRRTLTSADLSHLLTRNTDILVSSDRLKKRLWKAGILKKECSECGISTWREKPAPLQLDHISGDRYDNRIENLRILCANCHSQTDTWTSRNRKAGRTNHNRLFSNGEVNPDYISPECLGCGKPVNRKGNRCVACSAACRNAKQSAMLPSKDELKNRLLTSSYSELAKEFNVSAEAVRRKTGVGRSTGKLEFYCIDCNKKVSRNNSRCRSCAGKFYNETKIEWPSDIELFAMLSESNYITVARELGVSDNAIRKHLGTKPSNTSRTPKLCLDCGKKVGRTNSRCRLCANACRVTKIEWPSVEELNIMIEKSSRSAVARELGVASSTLKKRLVRYS